MPCALVLSAGGMFGAYQAGAWKALAGIFEPDMVVGASAGSLNGWAIAGGCTPADLIETWMNPATAAMMRPRFTFRPWRGCMDPAPLERHVRDLFARFRPRVPYSATVVQVPRLRRVRVPAAEITPAHLMASCAVPFGFPPVRIAGKLYVDGGLLDVLPIWAAAEMGATRVIAINVLPRMPSRTLRAAVGLVRRFAPPPPPIPGLDVTSIVPSAPLGSLRDAVIWSEENMRRWIRQGEADVMAAAADGAGFQPVRYANSPPPPPGA